MSKNSKTNTQAALNFLHALFGEERTEHKIFLCSLPNTTGDTTQPGPRELATRDTARAAEFIEQWDRPGRGMFFAVGTTDTRRVKDEICETIGLHCDMDFKGIEATAEEIERAIARLKCKATVRVNSGHGIHLYWLFEKAIETQESRDRIEELLRLLCDHVAGDGSVCEISRLMRLPGTHNTKFDSWVEVVCTQLEGPRYTPQQLGAWLGTTVNPKSKPLLRRRAVSDMGGTPQHSAEPDNPFVRMAQEQGLHLPIDIDERIALMQWQGQGEAGIHATRRDVSASMYMRGAELDEVVARLLPAIMAIAKANGQHWKEADERKLIVREYKSATKKFVRDEVDEPAIEPVPNPGPDGFTKATKPPKIPPKAGKGGEQKKHIVLALGVLQAIEERGERLLITQEGIWWYSDHLWASQDEKDLKRRLHKEIEIGAAVLGWATNAKLINEAREWLLRQPQIYQRDIVFDDHRRIPVINGLLNPHTGVLVPPAPEHYATWRIEQIYDPDALCPVFADMITHVFSDREPEQFQVIYQLLPELLGVGLVDRKSKALSRALIFVGGTDTGKSQLLRVMGALFGKTNATPIAALSNSNHALMPFRHRDPWILDEAADEGDWHKSSIVKSIISGDPISIDVKNQEIITQPFTAPVYWGTNHLPQFKEISRAIAERLILLECRQTFDKNNPIGAAKTARNAGYQEPADLVIETEMAGVLAFAIAGLRRAFARGHFVIPEESLQLMAELHEASNVAMSFRNECLAYHPGKALSRGDTYAMFCGHYAREFDIDKIPTQTRFALAMKGLADPRIITDKKLRLGNSGRRLYGCIEPTPYGLECWKLALNSQNFNLGAEKFPGASSSETGNPAIPLPAEWHVNTAVKRAKKLWDEEQKTNPSPSKNEPVEPVTRGQNGDEGDRSQGKISENPSPQKPLGRKLPRF